MEKLSIRLAKSLIGRGKEQIAVAKSLGLHRPGDVVELPAAHPLFFQVHHLEADAPLLKIALGLFGVETLVCAKDLDIHAFAVLSGFVPVNSCDYCNILPIESIDWRVFRHAPGGTNFCAQPRVRNSFPLVSPF